MKILLTLLVFLFLTDAVDFEINQENGQITVLGTSSVHDWESDVTKFSISGNMGVETINNLKVVIPVISIESGKDIMNDKTFEALKHKKHPNLIFESAQLALEGSNVAGEGELTIAGVTKTISIQGQIVSQTTTQANIQGKVDLKMSDYGIEPPTAMFGSLKTGNEVTIQFNLSIPK
ncbi:MAG: YceI family protein [Cyclobacteriaceae bacterium]